MQASAERLSGTYARVGDDAAQTGEVWEADFEAKIGLGRAQLNALVRDLKTPSRLCFWGDFAATWLVAAVSFGLCFFAEGSLARALWFLTSVCATYRMTLFTHELTHLPKGSVPGFRIAWNLFCGIPLLIPSFMYEAHLIHHDRRTYGTGADGEYLEFASSARSQGVLAVLSAALAVPSLIVRFAVLSPVSVLIPGLRRRVLQYASALNIDFRAARPVPEPTPASWLLQEVACFGWCLALGLLAYHGIVPLRGLLLAAAVLTCAVALNSMRVLAAHRYTSRLPRSFAEQVLDSNDFPRGTASLWAPLGLRYHAMHHLFPSLPYHALGEAHRRVHAALPEQSSLRQTVRTSLFSALNEVVGTRRRLEVAR